MYKIPASLRSDFSDCRFARRECRFASESVAISSEYAIGTDIIVQASVGSEKKPVYVKAADHFQTGVEGNWLDVMHTALRDYINEVKGKIK